MDKASVPYTLCMIEDDSSLTPVSEHEDIVAAIVAGKHQVEVEDFDLSDRVYANGRRRLARSQFANGRVGVDREKVVVRTRAGPPKDPALFCVSRLLAVFLSAFRHIALVKE